VTLSLAGLAAALEQGTATAALPLQLVATTTQGASLFQASAAAASGVVSSQVLALAQGVMKAMFASKLKIAAAAALTIGIAGSGASIWSGVGQADKAESAPVAERPSAKKEQSAEGKGISGMVVDP